MIGESNSVLSREWSQTPSVCVLTFSVLCVSSLSSCTCALLHVSPSHGCIKRTRYSIRGEAMFFPMKVVQWFSWFSPQLIWMRIKWLNVTALLDFSTVLSGQMDPILQAKQGLWQRNAFPILQLLLLQYMLMGKSLFPNSITWTYFGHYVKLVSKHAVTEHLYMF